MLRIEGVSRRYGNTTVLDSVSLALDAGSVTAVVGENGAGKTTLIKSVVGLIKFEGTITVGGAVTGLGIEASSFRNGLPHESVRSMDILIGTGEIVTAAPTGPHADLLRTFPNSYGSLGYAVSLTIDVEPVAPFVRLRHLPFDSLGSLTEAVGQIVAARAWDGEPVDFLDGVVFARNAAYLTLGRFAQSLDAAETPSDYAGQRIFYRSIRERSTDVLTVRDFLWRWDTDWFWCSRAFGAQKPLIRRMWPKSKLRSDVYWKIIAADRKYKFSDRQLKLFGKPPKEEIVQDIEVPVDRLAEFLDFFHRQVGVAGVDQVFAAVVHDKAPPRLFQQVPGDGQLLLVRGRPGDGLAVVLLHRLHLFAVVHGSLPMSRLLAVPGQGIRAGSCSGGTRTATVRSSPRTLTASAWLRWGMRRV